MRALHCVALGKPSALRLVETADLPAPRAGEVKVQVAADAKN